MIVEYKYTDKYGQKGETVKKIKDIPACEIVDTLKRIDTSIREITVTAVRGDRT